MKILLSQSKKTIKVMTLIFICLFTISFANAKNGNSSANSKFNNQASPEGELVLKSLNFKVNSALENGAIYNLQVQNNSGANHELIINVINNNSIEKNPDESATASNVDVEFFIFDENQNKISTLSIKNGESIKFFVLVNSPNPRPIGKWNCTKVELKPNIEGNSLASIVLHTFYHDLDEDN